MYEKPMGDSHEISHHTTVIGAERPSNACRPSELQLTINLTIEVQQHVSVKSSPARSKHWLFNTFASGT
jgi:hypothetical protein